MQAATPMDTKCLCAICLESPDLIMMPCCGRENASTRFCFRCIQIVCDLAADQRGTCPKCRAEITCKDGEVVRAPKNVGRCRMCFQTNKVIVERHMCDACALGSRHSLRYECDRCHRSQRIPQ